MNARSPSTLFAAIVLVTAILVPATAAAADGSWGTYGAPEIASFTAMPDGSLLGVDCGNARIYRVSASGTVTVFAGAGPGDFGNGYSGDGGPAIDAHFGCPYGVVRDGDGLLVTDHLNDAIRRIDRNGIITTIAGSGPLFKWSKGPWYPNVNHAGDGGPAIEAWLDAPTAVHRDPAGNLLIADRDHDAIRRVDREGTITTVAGTGQRGYSGDGGPATAAKINRPLDVAPLANGAFLIADENNSRVRLVDPMGRISTIAGTGKLGCGGLAGPALAASLQNVRELAVAPDGSVVLSQGECHAVRVIRPDGTIQPVIGTGEDRCGAVEGGVAVSTQLSDPYGVGFALNGDVLVADGACLVVLRVDASGHVHIVADLHGLGT